MTVIRIEPYRNPDNYHLAITRQGDLIHSEKIMADTNPVMVGIEVSETNQLSSLQVDTLNQLVEFVRKEKPCQLSFGHGLEYLSPVFPVTNLICRSRCTACQREVMTYYSRETGMEVAEVAGE
jgi:hypothetical protein